MWNDSLLSGQSLGIVDEMLMKFLKYHLPASFMRLHYRNVDMTTMNELAYRFWPTLHAARPRVESKHRALDDILVSIDVARYYSLMLQPLTLGTVQAQWQPGLPGPLPDPFGPLY